MSRLLDKPMPFDNVAAVKQSGLFQEFRHLEKPIPVRVSGNFGDEINSRHRFVMLATAIYPEYDRKLPVALVGSKGKMVFAVASKNATPALRSI